MIVLAGQVSAKSLAVSQPSLRDLRCSATLTRHWRAGLLSNVPSGLNPRQPSVTACRLGGAFLLHGLGMGFDKPQAFVYAAGNFGEDVGGVLVVQSVGLVNALRRPLHRKGFHAVTGCNAASGSTSRAMVCAFSYPHASATRAQRRPPPKEPVVPRHYQWIRPQHCKDWGARPSRSRCLASRQTHPCLPLIPGKEPAKKWGTRPSPPRARRSRSPDLIHRKRRGNQSGCRPNSSPPPTTPRPRSRPASDGAHKSPHRPAARSPAKRSCKSAPECEQSPHARGFCQPRLSEGYQHRAVSHGMAMETTQKVRT